MSTPPPVVLRCRACHHEPGGDEPGGDEAGGVEGVRVQYCERCFGPLDLLTVPAAPPGGWSAAATPLVQARVLGAAVGLRRLWLKDDTANPTGSFKDRLVASALERARQLGATVAACASTGNLGRAVSHRARAAGLDAVVLVPAGTGCDGAVEVAGGYDAVNRLASEAAMRWERWAWVNVTLRPFYVHGAAGVGYEIAEQLGGRGPDHLLAPIASGASLLRVHRCFAELHGAGLLAEAPHVRLSAAQPAGCAPVAAAFAAGRADVAPVRPATAVDSLAMGDPPDGPDLLAAVRSSDGVVDAVPEVEGAGAVDLLSRTEGIAVEPAGGVAVAALRRLAATGALGRDELVVAWLTGGPAPGKLAGTLGVAIEPTLEALARVLPDHLKDER